ncbi:MAG: trypsin-like peptidase domain-containing protein [Tannerella sp.]|nr:trypsin-like peptidase domain-containing protein [Tannerella sp.]
MKKWYIYLCIVGMCAALYSCKFWKTGDDAEDATVQPTEQTVNNADETNADANAANAPIVPAAAAAQPAHSQSISADIDKATSATFIIYTYDKYGKPSGYGSGFFIRDDGAGITNYHVLDGAVKAFIELADGSQYEIKRISSSSKDKDIAVFRVDNPDNRKFPFLKFADKPVGKGGTVYNISNPLRWRNSFSEGVVSALREDKKRGEMVQITAPISPGSSGSAILNDRFEVFAVAEGIDSRLDGQNLNFGVLVDKDMIIAMKSNDFVKNNPKFNSDEGDFIILNIPSDIDDELVLNAIDFGETATTLYLTYKDLDLTGIGREIWNQLYKRDKGFFIQDNTKAEKYDLTYSVIDNESEYLVQFKVHFPIIRDKSQIIDVLWNKKSNKWQFKGIDIEKYRKHPNVNFDGYRKEWAIARLNDTNANDAEEYLLELLDDTPNDIDVLIALGIISLSKSNDSKALEYFSKAIEINPNSATAYRNRAYLYMKCHHNLDKALIDLDKAISIDPVLHQLRDNFGYKYQITSDRCKDIYISYQLTKDEYVERILKAMWNNSGCR